MIGLFSGVRIIPNSQLVVGPFEDWSEVRSPGRAARRRRRGFPQRIRIYYRPDPKMVQLPDGTLVGHPVTIRALEQAIAEKSK
jgi:hypothetical protein